MLMEVAWFSSTLGFQPNKKPSIVTTSVSALPHMPNPRCSGAWQGQTHLWEWFLPKLAQMKASWFNQGFWLRWLQRELWGLGIRWQCRLWHSYKIHKYFHSNYVSSQTSNRGLGLNVSGGSTKQKSAVVTWMQGMEWDPQQDKLGHQTIKGSRIFFWLRQNATDRNVIVNTGLNSLMWYCHISFQWRKALPVQRLGGWPTPPVSEPSVTGGFCCGACCFRMCTFVNVFGWLLEKEIWSLSDAVVEIQLGKGGNEFHSHFPIANFVFLFISREKYLYYFNMRSGCYLTTKAYKRICQNLKFAAGRKNSLCLWC